MLPLSSQRRPLSCPVQPADGQGQLAKAVLLCCLSSSTDYDEYRVLTEYCHALVVPQGLAAGVRAECFMSTARHAGWRANERYGERSITLRQACTCFSYIHAGALASHYAILRPTAGSADRNSRSSCDCDVKNPAALLDDAALVDYDRL